MLIRDNPVCPWCKTDNTAIIPGTLRTARWCFACRITFDPRQVHIPAPQ